MILAIKTNVDPAELHLLNDSGKLVDKLTWTAGYELSATLLKKITALLKTNQLELTGLDGIIVYNRGGGFTSLRLGVLTANALAYGLDIPLAGSSGEDWLKKGALRLKNSATIRSVEAVYDRPPNITKPKR